MKKVYLGIVIGFVSGGTIAQTQLKQKEATVVHSAKPVIANYQEKATLWTNDFSTPADWTTQALTAPDNWVIGTAGPSGTFAIGPIQSTTAANGFALFDSDRLCSGTQNAIVRNTTPIDLSAETNVSVEFQSYYRAFNNSFVYVGFSTDAINWTYVEVHTNIAANQSTTNPAIVSLPAPVIGGSGNAYICFRYAGQCDYAWMVDDVKIISTPDYDLKTTYSNHHVDGYQYSQIPLAQVAETAFEVGVTNNGVNDLTNIELTVDVTGQATTTLNASIPTLTAGQIDTLTVSYTPNALGTYNFAQTLTLNETDEDPSNNSGLPNVTFEVTNFIYALDKGAPYTDYPNLEDIFLDLTIPYTELGNSFDIFQPAVLKGIDVHLSSNSTVGSEFYGQLYTYNSSASSAADLWTATGQETEMFVIDAGTALNTMHTLAFPNPVNLTAGTYMISVSDMGGGVVFSGSGALDTPQSWAIVQNNTGITWTRLSTTPVVRMNFNPALSVADVTAMEGVKVYPNPSEGVINVSNDTNVENTIVVTDIAGKIVATKVASTATTIDLGNFGTGIYLVEVANQNGKKVERVVIK